MSCTLLTTAAGTKVPNRTIRHARPKTCVVVEDTPSVVKLAGRGLPMRGEAREASTDGFQTLHDGDVCRKTSL